MHYDDQDVVVLYTLVKNFVRVLRVLRVLRILRVEGFDGFVRYSFE